MTNTLHKPAPVNGAEASLRLQPSAKTVRALAVLVVGALAVSACSGTRSPRATPATSGTGLPDGEAVIELGRDEVVLTARLVRFDECDALLEHLRSEAAERVGPWGFGDGGYATVGFEDGAVAEDVADEAADRATDSASPEPAPAAPALTEGVDYSGTNVQEAGVDEADIVKTDGRRLFVLSAGRLVVVDTATREALGSVRVAAGQPAELFLHGDSLLAIGGGRDHNSDRPRTTIERIDVLDGVPEIVHTITVAADYVSARSVGGTARVILRSQPPRDFPFVHPAGNPESEAVAEQTNRATVMASTLDDWLPGYVATPQGGAESEGLLPPCEQVHAPTVFSGFGVTTVLSVPVAGGIDPAAATAVLAPGDTVYASPESLYVSTTAWVDPSADAGSDIDWDRLRSEWRTNIHRFDISDPAQAVYTASGDVPGEIHNQFSLSEHAGHLRVVTTTDDRWSTQSESHVRILQESDGRLVEVGSVGDIGRGERVQSVRFAGDVGYVVTFRQVDPFYTIDLSDPAEPAVLGELKIPGFSSYLHPIGDGLVLGVGSDADDAGRVTGAKVSLFDVSDLAEPREVAVWTADDGWNDIGWDHRAFLWWAPESLAVIPVTVGYEWSGAVVLRVADGTIEEAGRITHGEGDSAGAECRQLDETDVTGSDDLDPDSPPPYEDLVANIAWWMLHGEDSWYAVACEVGEAGLRGFDCAHIAMTYEEDASARERVVYSADESLWGCVPSGDSDAPVRRIVRSIVIGDDLWTLSHPYDRYYDDSNAGRLQANDIVTLEFSDAVNL